MRLLRYSLLGLAVAAAVASLALVAAGGSEELARERARGLARTLADQLDSFKEHALFLADQPVGNIEKHMRAYRGLARVRIQERDGFVRIERLEYVVATRREKRVGTPVIPPPGRVVVSDFYRDEERLDVDPSRRTVVDYAVRRKETGVLRLTVYAEPFLQPLRNAGANLIDQTGRPLLGPDAAGERAGPGWTVSVPPRRDLAPYLWIALLVVGLAAALVFLSERQLRAAERTALERELEQSERLRSLGLLTAGIAHEINNPLEGIANWLAVGNVEKAQEGFERIRTITGDLLNFTRARPDEETADLRACVERAAELARYTKNEPEIEHDLPDGLEVRGAPHAVEQVLLNLLLNAGQAGARRVEIHASRQGADVRVDVMDDGSGIDPADLPHLFDPFFTRSGGTGLGLSVSYGLVRAMGGRLTAANRPDRGAQMTVELKGT